MQKTLLFLLSILTLNATAQNDSIWRNAELNQIVVTGTRTPKTLKDTPIQTRVITAADIAKVDATDIEDLLRQELPGVEFSLAMSQQKHLNFSGFGGQNVLFLIDGERLAGETADDIDFSRLNMANVERIEIIKGAASALYGSNATGGVINVITKTPAEPWTLNVNGRIACHDEWRYGTTFGLNTSKVQNVLAFSSNNIASYDVSNGPNPQTVNIARTFYGERTYNVNDKLTFRPSDALRLTMRAGYFFREKQTTSPALPDHYRDFTAGVRGYWTMTPDDNLEVSYNFDQYDKAQHQQVVNLCVRNYSNVQNTFRALYNHTFANGDILTFGGDYMRDYLLNNKLQDASYVQHSADAFAQYDMFLSPELELVGALRYDYFSDGNNHRLTPKFNACYKPNANLTLRAGYGMGFRTPTLKEKYYILNAAGIWDIIGSNIIGYDLVPEISHNFNVSADYTKGHYNFTASSYYNMIRNRITTGLPQPASVFPGDKQLLATDQWLPYTNIENYNAFGFDLTAQARWDNGLSARLSYAFVHEEMAKSADGQPVNNQYTPARPHTLTVRTEWDHRFSRHYALDVALSGRVLSSVDNVEYVDYITRDPNTNELLRKTMNYGAYTIWRLSTTHHISKAFKLTLAVDNLFNYNPEYHYLNAPFTDGASLQVGLSIDIDKL